MYNMNIGAFFSLKRFFSIVVIFLFGLTLIGCGGSKKKKEQPAEKPAAEQKGSLSRTFTVVDEQGRNAGTLILDFSGGAVLRDANGKVIGTFKPAESAETQPSETQSKPQATEINRNRRSQMSSRRLKLLRYNRNRKSLTPNRGLKPPKRILRAKNSVKQDMVRITRWISFLKIKEEK